MIFHFSLWLSFARDSGLWAATGSSALSDIERATKFVFFFTVRIDMPSTVNKVNKIASLSFHTRIMLHLKSPKALASACNLSTCADPFRNVRSHKIECETCFDRQLRAFFHEFYCDCLANIFWVFITLGWCDTNIHSAPVEEYHQNSLIAASVIKWWNYLPAVFVGQISLVRTAWQSFCGHIQSTLPSKSHRLAQ